METSEQKLQELKNRFGIAGNAPSLNEALNMAVKVAPTDITVLILGESGTGKEVFSKIIHQLSHRKHNKSIAVNCGAIPEGTIDSELFGHEKGAFTSAYDTRKGYFETVNGGSIFLDEIAEMPLNTQSRLLRLLENGEFLKVGSSQVQKTDVRVITATNKNLYEFTRKGKFREDLYYRLSTVTIKIPSLRERIEDIPFLFAKFAADASEKYKMPPLELTPEAEEILKAYSWPGNVRQLKNVIEQVSVLETNRNLTENMLNKYLPAQPGEKVAIRTGRQDQTSEEFESFREREVLYKFLFEIKRDISDLKELMHGLVQTGSAGSSDQKSESFNRPLRYLDAPKYRDQTRDHDSGFDAMSAGDDEQYENETVPADYEEGDETADSLSLKDKEKVLIKQALKKYRGKRKNAARELGISERTLYRKIKEYNLETL